MTLVAPKLDDRQFQDLVNEAKKRIPHYCKEWTDHNVSDPGVTLIELFAWMTDIILYRQNQIPDRHYIKFLDMLGVTLKEPTPAHVPVTFWLSTPQEIPALIPAGTEVASTQTETQRSIVFTTTRDFEIHPPELSHVRTRVTDPNDGTKKGFKRPKSLRSLLSGFESNILQVFSPVPQVDDALYFGFKNDLSDHVLRFDLDFDPAIGAGIDPTLPPYVWEASTGKDKPRWETCDIEIDTTKGMNSPGRIQIHLPAMGTRRIDGQNIYWVRARIKEITASEQEDGMRPYQESPKLRRVLVTSIGGTVEATHAQVIKREFLGQSDGSTGQRFFLQNKPLLARESDETLVVQVEDKFQSWTEVSDFGDSNSIDNHFTLDGVTGEVRLGPAIRQQDGTIKLFGAIPPQGANLFFQQYRFGGGQDGNVGAGILNTLKTAIPYISRVANRESAWGGLDPESLESAMMRAPALLRSRERAVTESDYEFLAKEALPTRIGRVKCLQPRPATRGRIEAGQIFVLIIPRVPRPKGYIEPDLLTPNEADVAALTEYLDERRLLTTQLNVRAPEYEWVSVKVFLRPIPGASEANVEAQILNRLYRFLNPLSGGPQGQGWPFGHSLFVSEVYQCLQGIPDVQFIRGVELYSARPSGETQGDPVESIDLLGHGIIASGTHSVEFV
jgi:predicted phage baseplate assembly protein